MVTSETTYESIKPLTTQASKYGRLSHSKVAETQHVQVLVPAIFQHMKMLVSLISTTTKTWLGETQHMQVNRLSLAPELSNDMAATIVYYMIARNFLASVLARIERYTNDCICS